ncbi:hypothetical protein AGMMS49975_26340 [Clostridia bacterium]|nr:hypothetical protein AGMMS49975_26340 [Clostridia bacterium]
MLNMSSLLKTEFESLNKHGDIYQFRDQQWKLLSNPKVAEMGFLPLITPQRDLLYYNCICKESVIKLCAFFKAIDSIYSTYCYVYAKFCQNNDNRNTSLWADKDYIEPPVDNSNIVKRSYPNTYGSDHEYHKLMRETMSRPATMAYYELDEYNQSDEPLQVSDKVRDDLCKIFLQVLYNNPKLMENSNIYWGYKGEVYQFIRPK